MTMNEECTLYWPGARAVEVKKEIARSYPAEVPGQPGVPGDYGIARMDPILPHFFVETYCSRGSAALGAGPVSWYAVVTPLEGHEAYMTLRAAREAAAEALRRRCALETAPVVRDVRGMDPYRRVFTMKPKLKPRGSTGGGSAGAKKWVAP